MNNMKSKILGAFILTIGIWMAIAVFSYLSSQLGLVDSMILGVKIIGYVLLGGVAVLTPLTLILIGTTLLEEE